MTVPREAGGAELRRLVAELVDEVTALRAEVAARKDENAALRAEITRLKGLPGRPKVKPSGMERATAPRGGRPPSTTKGAGRAGERVIHEERVLVTAAPPGSRFKGYEDVIVQDKGYEDVIVQDLRLAPRVIRYRRQRWRTPDGRTLVAPLPAGVRGHFGPELRRFVLAQHHQGQVTAERIAAFLNGLGLAISKRQVGRLLTAHATAFIDEAEAVLRAGLETARWLTVDDTGARHRAKNGVTTQIGSDHFTFFATGAAKSRRNFLEVLRAGHGDYAVNDDALAYMRAPSRAR